MGKFFNGNVKTSKSTTIKIAIVAVCAILIIVILIALNNKKNPQRANLKLYNNLDVEINSEKPETMDFFSVFDNYDVNKVKVTYPDDFSTKVVGTYEVKITIEGKEYTTKVNVYDDKAPELEVKDFEIEAGKRYYVEDFVESCSDNSGEACTIEYYSDSKDQDGNAIDYSKYTEAGNYLIKIIAKDENGNVTEPKSVNLKLTDASGNTPPPDPSINPNPTVECKYGDLSYDEKIYTYPIAVIVGDEQNNCALNRDLWDNDDVQKPVVELYKRDLEKLKTDFNKIYETKYPNGAHTYIYQDFKAVLNKENKGLVGYAVYVKLYASEANLSIDKSTAENLIAEYYLKADGSREYIQNPYNIN